MSLVDGLTLLVSLFWTYPSPVFFLSLKNLKPLKNHCVKGWIFHHLQVDQAIPNLRSTDLE
jgi:hypothetical protein